MSITCSKSPAQVKLELKEVIDNLKLLEKSHTFDAQQLLNIQQKTEQLLNDVENKPLENIRDTLKKNKKRRQRKKLLKRLIRESHQNADDNDVEIKSEPEEKPPITRINHKSVKRSRMYHHHLRSMRECQRFLKTFELLEQLHLARGQDPTRTQSFSAKLQHLKSVWNCMLQEQQDENLNSEQQIQQQWNEVLFGAAEKTYFEGKPNLKYFQRKRRIWDSYIDNKYGTTIPIGWVFPPLKPNDKWSVYLANNKTKN